MGQVQIYVLQRHFARTREGKSHIPRVINITPHPDNEFEFDGSAAVAQLSQVRLPWENVPDLNGWPKASDAYYFPPGRYQLRFDTQCFLRTPRMTAIDGVYEGVVLLSADRKRVSPCPELFGHNTFAYVEPQGLSDYPVPKRSRSHAYVATTSQYMILDESVDIIIPGMRLLSILAFYANPGNYGTPVVNTRADWRQIYCGWAWTGDGHWTVWP